MATSLKKLKIGPGLLGGADVVGYLSDPQDVGDYYTEDGTAPMNWLATERVRTIFALHPRRVSTTTLRQLIEGLDPVTGQFIRRYGPDGTMVGAIDLTVSPAPKSVSVLWALGDDKLRFELEVMVGQAVDSAVRRMLREQPLTRERQGEHVVPAVAEDYVAVQVMHTTARMSASSGGVPDPQLHMHNVLIGAVDEKNRLRALDSLAIMRYRAELDAEASGRLAELLRQRGFEIERRLERRRNGQPRVVWEVAGIPQSLIEAMSSRTAEIEDLKKKFEEMYGRAATGPAWEAWIAGQRGPKAHLSAAELRLEWALEAERHGLSVPMLDALVAEADGRRAAGIRERDEHSPEAMELRRLILENVNRDHAFIPIAQMERMARQLAVGLLDPLVVDRVIADMVGDGDLLETMDDQVTTLEVMRYEQRARTAAAKLLIAEPFSPVARELVERELARREEEGRPFDERQAAAIRLATSGARFVSITGPAGTGKGYATAAMTELWHRRGRRVLAVAVAGRTAQQAAADSGADEALNIDLLLTRLEHGRLALSRRDVVLADEAGMIDHARYAPLLEAIVRSGATLVQVGDDHQLSPVGPGGLWTTTHRQAEAAGQAVELDVVRRARDRREAQAWGDLRHGRIVEALAWMRDEGRLVLYETRPELLRGLVEDWWAGDRDGLIVVDSSNAERDELNRLAQARRLEAGELGPETLRISSGRELRRGDRVLFSAIYRPEPAQGQQRVRRVENGTSAVVVEVGGRGAVLELREGDQVRRLEVGPDVPLELAYARHVVKAQGVTHEDTDLAISRQTRRNELYVMATRARAGARFHAVAAELREGDLAAAEAWAAWEAGHGPHPLAAAPMTETQAVVLEHHNVAPDPSWTWVQASLAIDFATRGVVGRQAALWLQAMGLDAETAEQVIERALRPIEPEAESTAPESAPEPVIPPMTEAQRTLLEERGVAVDTGWTWVQASLAIDVATGTPIGRRATEWLREQGYGEAAAARIVEQARSVESPAQVEEATPRPAEAAPAVEATPAPSAGALPPGATPASELLAEIEAERARREQATEYVTIRAIHRQAEALSTKEAVGHRLMRAASARRTSRLDAASTRDELRSEWEAERSGATSEKWEASYAHARMEAPTAAREAAQEAAQGQVQRRPTRAPERLPQPLPARDMAENVLGRREVHETSTSMGYYQAVGRLEQTADPAGRAVELLAEDPRTVVVAATPDLWREVRQRAEAAGLPLDHEGQPRVLQGEAAYRARLERRQAWQAEQPKEQRHVIEPGVIERAHVVTDDPWASPALTRAVSVAAESHVVVPQLRPGLAQEVDAEAARMRAAMETGAEQQRAQQATRVREAAYDRGAQAEAGHAADRAAARQATAGALPPAQPQPTPPPEAERGGAER